MSKPLVITPRKLVTILKNLGFQLDHTTGSHFIFYQPQTKKRAVVPYHQKDLPKGTLMSILKEAGVNRKELETAMKKEVKISWEHIGYKWLPYEEGIRTTHF